MKQILQWYEVVHVDAEASRRGDRMYVRCCFLSGDSDGGDAWKKERQNILLRHPPYRHVTILQLIWLHYFTVGCMWKCSLSRAAVHAHSAAPLTAMMNCVAKCVCLCVCERVRCFGLKLQPQQGGSVTKWESCCCCCWGVQQPAVGEAGGVGV